MRNFEFTKKQHCQPQFNLDKTSSLRFPSKLPQIFRNTYVIDLNELI